MAHTLSGGQILDGFEIQREDFAVAVGDRRFAVTLLSPSPKGLAAEPALLLTFATGREGTLFNAPYNHTAHAFLAAGHRALSFDFIGHGERIEPFGEGIRGLRDALVEEGVDPFAVFAEDAGAVLDECGRRGWAVPGRIAACGTSRGGYLALYLAACEPRVAAAAGFAPVTDWRILAEFAADVGRAEVGGLALHERVSALAEKAIFMAIGKADDRVGSAECAALYGELVRAGSEVEFVSTEDPGHTVGAEAYGRGAAWLLERFSATE